MAETSTILWPGMFSRGYDRIKERQTWNISWAENLRFNTFLHNAGKKHRTSFKAERFQFDGSIARSVNQWHYNMIYTGHFICSCIVLFTLQTRVKRTKGENMKASTLPVNSSRTEMFLIVLKRFTSVGQWRSVVSFRRCTSEKTRI